MSDNGSSSGLANALLSHFQTQFHNPLNLDRSSLTHCVACETRSIPLHCSCHTRRKRASHTLGLWCTLPTICSPGHRPPGSQRGGGPGCRLERGLERGYMIVIHVTHIEQTRDNHFLWGIWAIRIASKNLIVERFDRKGLHQLQNWRNYRSDWT